MQDEEERGGGVTFVKVQARVMDVWQQSAKPMSKNAACIIGTQQQRHLLISSNADDGGFVRFIPRKPARSPPQHRDRGNIVGG